MGMHPTLKRAGRSSKFRSVMKRRERIQWLIEKGVWSDDSRVFGLPKIKVLKIKAGKKEKPKEEEKKEEAAKADTGTKK